MEFEVVQNEMTWPQQFRLFINEEEVKWPDVHLEHKSGSGNMVRLDYEHSNLIGDPRANIALEFKAGEALNGMTAAPPFGQTIAMAEGTTTMQWYITPGTAKNGSFTMQFIMPQMESMPDSPPLPGRVSDVNPGVVVYLDGTPVSSNTLHLCVGTTSQLNIRPHSWSPYLNKQVYAVYAKASEAEPNVVFSPSLEEQQLLDAEGVTWNIDCQNGTPGSQFVVTTRLNDQEIVLIRAFNVGVCSD
jgi:hypothetical protein